MTLMEASKEELEALLARVEGATGPDREIDADLHLAFGQEPNEHYLRPWRKPILVDPKPGLLEYVEISGVSARAAPAYTASLDAALALVERVMGEKSPLVGVDRNYGFDNDIPGSEETPRWNAWCYGEGGEHPTSPATALLIALLRAKAKDAQQVGSPQAVSAEDPR